MKSSVKFFPAPLEIEFCRLLYEKSRLENKLMDEKNETRAAFRTIQDLREEVSKLRRNHNNRIRSMAIKF